MPKFRKKPVLIEAVQWNGQNSDEIVQWAQGGWDRSLPLAPIGNRGIWLKQCAMGPPTKGFYFRLMIPTLEGEMEASVGDWIIRGIKGEYYPCKPDIFHATYEPAA